MKTKNSVDRMPRWQFCVMMAFLVWMVLKFFAVPPPQTIHIPWKAWVVIGRCGTGSLSVDEIYRCGYSTVLVLVESGAGSGTSGGIHWDDSSDKGKGLNQAARTVKMLPSF